MADLAASTLLTGGLLDRANNKVLDQKSLDALLTGAK